MSRYPIAIDISNDAVHVTQLGESKKGIFIRGFASMSIDNNEPWSGEAEIRVFEFFKEIRSGDPLDVFTHIVREGARSLTIAHRMTRPLDSATVATAEIVTVCFDLRERRARQLPAKGNTVQPGK